MSYARTMLAKYWFVPWLRRRGLDMLRQEHVARWAFKKGDIVVKPYCGFCGAHNHYGFVTKVVRSPVRTYALVRMVCKKGEEHEVGTVFLKHPLPPYPKEVLDLRSHIRSEKRERRSQ